MSKTILNITAALMAATALGTPAQAGGIRLGFGFPLGVFAASQVLASGPGGGHHDVERPRSLSRGEEHAPRIVKHSAPKEEVAEAPVRKVRRAAPKDVVAEAPVRKVKHAAPKDVVAEAPVRKVRRVAPKVEVAETPAPRPHALIKTAKLEDPLVVNDVTPAEASNSAAHADAVFASPAPTAQFSSITGTQSTPTAVRTASLATRVTPSVTEPAPKPAAKSKIAPEVKRLCRKFSAAIAGLIEIPCD